MYNQEIKERFLTEVTSGGRNEKSCRAIFEKSGVSEMSLQKDLCTMTKEEMKLVLRNTNAGTYTSAFTVISLIRRYVRWCADNSVFRAVNKDLLNITVDDVDISDDLKKQLFESEEEFIDALRHTRPLDDGYFDVIIMVFFWLGISQKQMMNIKIYDVDFSDKAVVVDGVRIPFSDKICEVLSMYAKTKTGTRLNKNGPRVVYRDDSYDFFIRKFSPQKQLGSRLTQSQFEDAIYNLNKAYVEAGNEPRFTGGNILSSGALCRLRELENSGVDVLSIKSKLLVSDAFRVKAKLHEILWLYTNYKKAFSV